MTDSEKLQKVLAREGLGSRREMERWIADGRIEIDGKVATLGDRVTSKTKIVVNGRPLHISAEPAVTRVIIYHKPVGQICTRNDPEGRDTVFDHLPRINQGRWISVGRLDINSSGLLLFTNDGELANHLMHPSHVVEREYAVRIFGQVMSGMVKRLTTGVRLDDGMARFEDVVDSGGSGANRWFHVVVTEGRNRLVRRLWESQSVQVSRLVRVRFGPIFLDKALREGRCKDLSAKQIHDLREAAGLSN